MRGISKAVLSLIGLLSILQLSACQSGTPTPTPSPTPSPTASATLTPTPSPTPSPTPHPLSIAALENHLIQGGEIETLSELERGANYRRFITAYPSDGLAIRALLTVPDGEVPETGWPGIVFNHGYIPPAQYQTAARYKAYVDVFARRGYMVFMSDYRGHGQSEGDARGGYGNNEYTVDVLNALASLRQHPEVDEGRLGIWGHSMGGHISLRSMVVTDTLKAGVIWAGVVVSYPDLISRWRRPGRPTPRIPARARRWRTDLFETYGSPEENPDFWASISSNAFLDRVDIPVQLHHGTADSSVPHEFSEILEAELTAVGGEVEFFSYPGDDHNLSASLFTALERSADFFDEHVKGASGGSP